MSETFTLENTFGVLWITGYSGSGKTTVSRLVTEDLRRRGVPVVLFDGDDLRGILGNSWGYGRDDRVALGFVNFRLFGYIASQGMTVVVAAAGIYDEVLTWARSNVPRIAQVYLEVSNEERLRRDRGTKKVYDQLKDLSSLYDPPTKADLTIVNEAGTSPEKAAAQVVEFYLSGQVADRSEESRAAYWRSHYSKDISRRQVSEFANLVSTKMSPGGWLLDVGSGEGSDLLFYGSLGMNCIGVEPAMERVSLEGPNGRNCHVLHGKLPDVQPQLARKFDVVTCRGVLDSVSAFEAKAILRASLDSLKPDGIFIMEGASDRDAKARKGEVLGPGIRHIDRFRRFLGLAELYHQISEAGGRVVSAEETSTKDPIYGDDGATLVVRLIANKKL